MCNELSQANFVSIANDARLIRHESLTIQVRSVSAAEIDDSQRVFVAAGYRRMNPRNPFF
jgi:hypothetical protein